jgi:hypothetical protein
LHDYYLLKEKAIDNFYSSSICVFDDKEFYYNISIALLSLNDVFLLLIEATPIKESFLYYSKAFLIFVLSTLF